MKKIKYAKSYTFVTDLNNGNLRDCSINAENLEGLELTLFLCGADKVRLPAGCDDDFVYRKVRDVARQHDFVPIRVLEYKLEEHQEVKSK